MIALLPFGGFSSLFVLAAAAGIWIAITGGFKSAEESADESDVLDSTNETTVSVTSIEEEVSPEDAAARHKFLLDNIPFGREIPE